MGPVAVHHLVLLPPCTHEHQLGNENTREGKSQTGCPPPTGAPRSEGVHESDLLLRCVAFLCLGLSLLSEDDDGPWRLGALPTNAREAAAHAIPPA